MYAVAIDIGGTFTDCAVMDEAGHVVCIAKSPSTRADPSDGVFGALAVAAEQLGQSLDELLAKTRLFIHGCTVATNAMIERSGAPTGLLTTRGHEDAIIGWASSRRSTQSPTTTPPAARSSSTSARS